MFYFLFYFIFFIFFCYTVASNDVTKLNNNMENKNNKRIPFKIPSESRSGCSLLKREMYMLHVASGGGGDGDGGGF